MKLRLISYNMHKGRSSMGRARLPALAKALQKQAPDLVFLQEIQGRNHKHAHLDEQPEVLMHALGYEGVYGLNAQRRYSHHGNALLSRFPIESHQNHHVSDHRFEQRGLLHVTVRTPQGRLHCLVAHLGLFKGSRLRQVQAILQTVQSIAPHEPIVLAGDFNDWNQHLNAPILQSGAWQDAFGTDPARTFPSFMPVLPLDRVYVRGLQVQQAQVLREPPWPRISDHLPLCVTLILPANAPHQHLLATSS